MKIWNCCTWTVFLYFYFLEYKLSAFIFGFEKSSMVSNGLKRIKKKSRATFFYIVFIILVCNIYIALKANPNVI